MDLFQPGLPKKVLREIRSTNTISFRLVEQLKQLNEQTNDALAMLGPDPAAGQSSAVEDIFSSFYYDMSINNLKLSAVPEIKLAKLRSYHERLEKAGASSEQTLVQIINQYTAVILLHHLANAIICKTVVAKAQLGYWSDLKTSNYAKIVYGVQTLPYRSYRTAWRGVGSAMAASNESRTVGSVLRSTIEAIRATLQANFEKIHVSFVAKRSRLSFLSKPLRLLDCEIKDNIEAVSARLRGHYEILGAILNELPVQQATIPRIVPGCGPDVLSQIQAVQRYVHQDDGASATAPPNFVSRYWPVLLLAVNFGPSTTANVWRNRNEIISWVRHNLVDTAVGFWSNWVVKPVTDMLNILRNDDTMTITSKESLKSDLDSLERMVTDYLRDIKVDVPADQIHSAVAQGDLTLMMSEYESELRTPYKSILKGSLIRSILIQVQKTKVDGGLAINGIDKLLKSQQLLFGVLSISPSLVFLYQANKLLHSDSALSKNAADRRISCLKSMNEIEKLVNREQNEDKLVGDGKLFVEIVNLTLLAKNVIPKKLGEEFLLDLNGLALHDSENHKGAKNRVDRLWNMYAPYFRK